MQHEWQVPMAAAGTRLDVWLEGQLDGVSRSLIQRLLREGRCTIHPGQVRAGRTLHGGERIALEVPEMELPRLEAEDLPLTVLHEDEHLVAIDKPPGLVVHPAPGHARGTLMNAVLHRWGPIAGAPEPAAGEDDGEPAAAELLRLGLVHRLDAETSGIVVVARTARALAHLQESFRERRVRKRYLALVAGQPRADYLACDAPLGRHAHDFRKRAVVPAIAADARAASTTAVVLWRGDGYAAVEARPRTGRTHQIRVHLAHLGHAVLADPLYGRSRTWPLGAAAGDPAALCRHALHAWTLDLPHPAGGELALAAPIPADLARWLPAPVAPRPW